MFRQTVLTSTARSGRVPRVVTGIVLFAIAVAIIASSPAQEPKNVTAGSPVLEDWHGNVRRSR